MQRKETKYDYRNDDGLACVLLCGILLLNTMKHIKTNKYISQYQKVSVIF